MLGRKMVSGVAALTLAALTGCGGAGESRGAVAEPAVVRLGTLVPITGPSSGSGAAMLNAAKLAVREANAGGGILGRPVELVAADDACDPGTAVTAAQALVARDIAVSVGGFCSTAVVPTLPIFRSAGVPMIVARAHSAELREHGHVFLISGGAGIVPRLAPELADWSARYTKVVGSAPGPSTVEAYDAVNIALNAIERAGRLDRAAVSAAIAATDSEFMSGPVSFAPDGTRVTPSYLTFTP